MSSALYHAQALQGRSPDGRPLFALPALELPPGVHLVLGDEGTGKTTLLRLLAGEFPAHVGQAVLCGHDLHQAPAAYRQDVAWFDPANTAWEQTVVNDLWAEQSIRFARWNAELLEDLAQALGLQEHRAKPMYMLSTGSRRKALTAAALASGAALTLLDMPFAALDAGACRVLREVLADCADHPTRAFVVADYAAPTGVAVQQRIELGS
ncbi:ATP-binding cassette domain-containing protein [Curvibacter sp. APW13]|uniref:ABC transporter ATP-binding protein n=1 Tax=Curvibacter sp. APW13 TaxID=3077236 RepID=UPI0028DF43B0|nr:ATP-binding cassette domain-containing protein [Curvibacter sp. APW13]MDT8991042.1 ATP-binding cassette domain-containing protein [Curvibacter sp. APW13]